MGRSWQTCSHLRTRGWLVLVMVVIVHKSKGKVTWLVPFDITWLTRRKFLGKFGDMKNDEMNALVQDKWGVRLFIPLALSRAHWQHLGALWPLLLQ